MTKFRKIICTILAMTLLIGLVAEPAQAKPKANCKSLCSAALKATGGSANLKYASKSALDFTAAEKQVFQNAVCGQKGKYVWYIAMSPKKDVNMKGQTALKKKL